MPHWDLRALDVESHHPEVLHSAGEGRTIVIQVPAGEMLQEHQVHERAWLVVIDGEVEIARGDEGVAGGPGTRWRSSSPPSATRCAPPPTRACSSSSRPGPVRATPATRSRGPAPRRTPRSHDAGFRAYTSLFCGLLLLGKVALP